MTKTLRILLLSGQDAENIPFQTEKFIPAGKNTAAALIEAIGNFSGDFVFFTGAGGEEPLPELLELMRKEPDLTLAEIHPEKKRRLPLPDAVLNEEISPEPEGKLIRVPALKTALKLQDSAGPFSELATLAILCALSGIAAPGRKRRKRTSSDPALSAGEKPRSLRDRCREYASFSTFANALPCNGGNAAVRRMHIDSVLYRMLAREIRRMPDRTLELLLPEFTGTLDDRLLYYALRQFRRPLLARWRPAVRKLPPAPVRNLALACASLRNGDTEHRAALLSEMFVEMGLKVTFFTLEPETARDYPHPGCTNRTVLPEEPHLQRAAFTEELKTRAIDTCVFFNNNAHWTMNAILCARAAGVRTIAMEHSAYAYPWFAGIPDIALERDCVYPAADVVTALSRADRTAWRTKGIARCICLPEPLTPPAEDTARKTPLLDGGKNLIFAGHLTELRGADKALDVLALVRAKHPDARLLMAGYSDSREYNRFLRDKAERNGIADAVKFLGAVGFDKTFCRTAIHLIPSAMEGFPAPLMEAKAHRIPTVLFALPYLDDTKEEHGCIQVPQGNIRAMADAVIRLLDDPEELTRLGTFAHDSLKHFSMDSLRKRWREIFDFLETGRDLEGIFAEKETPEELLRLHEIHQRTMADAWKRCLEHPDFLQSMNGKMLAEYFRKHPFLHLLTRAGRIFPGLFFRRLFVLSRKSGLKKYYRKIRARHDTSGRSGFPD